MIRVLLVHGGQIPHYRVAVYAYLADYLKNVGYALMVAADGVDSGASAAMPFPFFEINLSAWNIFLLVREQHIDVVIDYMELRHPYLFPTYFLVKGLLRKRFVYWGQGRDLLQPKSIHKNLAYALE